MRNFILGVIVTLIVLVVGGLAFALLGFMPTNADATPPHLERRIAARALDASMEHHAPRVNNPVQVTDENLIYGMKVYPMNCALRLAHWIDNRASSPRRFNLQCGSH